MITADNSLPPAAVIEIPPDSLTYSLFKACLKKARGLPQANCQLRLGKGSDKPIHPQWVDEAGLWSSPGIGALYKQLRESGLGAPEKAFPWQNSLEVKSAGSGGRGFIPAKPFII